MKIEIAESLMYSWLRHVEGCQIVQTNWTSSPLWDMDAGMVKSMENFMDKVDAYFSENFKEEYSQFIEENFSKTKAYKNGSLKFSVFKKNSNLDQVISQAECDLIGMSINEDSEKLYAVEVAYHSGGMNYGAKHITAMKVVEKIARAAICMNLFFYKKKGEILFVTPVIQPGYLATIKKCMSELQRIMREYGLDYQLKFMYGDIFRNQILEKLCSVSSDISDTNELFLRSYGIVNMFQSSTTKSSTGHIDKPSSVEVEDVYFGKAARKIPKWANSSNQINYKIVRSFFKATEMDGTATVRRMRELCQDEEKYPDMYIGESFAKNYPSMKIDAQRSHGKVFEDDGGKVVIWDEIKDTLMKYKDLFTK